MAKHFSDEKNPAQTPAHAPASAPAHTQQQEPVGFVPVMHGSAQAGKHASRVKHAAYVETDPYDIKGRRSKSEGRARRIVSNVLLAVGIILLLVAGGIFGFQQWNYHQQNEVNKKLATFATVATEGDGSPQVDWAGLRAINKEAVAWIEVPGTNINYPIYKGPDNDKYLRHTAEGQWSIGGQIFMDYLNQAPGLKDQQTIIYGHHMQNGTMFQPIADMTNQENFNKHSTIWFVTDEGATEMEPLLIYDTDANDKNVRRFNFNSDEELRSYLLDLLAKSLAKNPNAEQMIQKTKHVLTLVTCKEAYGDGRTLLICVPKSEVAS